MNDKHVPAVRPVEQIVNALNWESTPLGPRASWPAALRFAVRFCLASRFPLCIWWGPKETQVYNDAYAPLLGKRHPAAMGQSGGECWPELWDEVGPMLAHTRATGEPFWAEDMHFTVERNGFAEDAYFTFSYSRVDGDADDDESGILCAVTETTGAVIREREFRAMADTIANIVYTHAADGTIEWVNSRWRDYTGLPPEIATSLDGWLRVSHPDDQETLRAALQRAFADGTAYELELRIKPDGRADAAYRWFLLRAVPMRAPTGATVRWAGSATDVHDRRIAEDAIRTQLRREHQASRAFQVAALPQTLPAIPGLKFHAVYEAAEAEALVGGDWYDAFRLPDGRVVFSIGDVIGSGLDAAVTMAGVRQAIRGAAEVHPEPVDVLDAVDRALRSEQPDRIVTAFVGVLDPLTLVFSYASAGHPAPLIRQRDGAIVQLDAGDVPLGLRGERRSERTQSASTTLLDGSLMVLYTDGLTESTRNILEGEEKLHRTLRAQAVYEADDPAAAIRRAMLATPGDDVAILTVRITTQGLEQVHTRWFFPSSDGETAMRIRSHIGELLKARGAAPEEAHDAELVFGELLGNVVRHTAGDVEAALDLSGSAPVLHVLDRGPGFTFYARLPKESLSESGRGLFITMMLARDFSVVPRRDGGSHARAVLATRPLRRDLELTSADFSPKH